MKVRPATYSNLLKTGLIVLLLVGPFISRCQTIPLPNAFAHNDYSHTRPLFDALDNGYTNIEADIFLESGELIVAHINPFFKSERTLESLYFKPLYDHIKNNNGEVYKNYDAPVILMIDIKTGADNTYKALKPLLEKYKGMLSAYDHGQFIRGAVTVVISGHKPYKMVKEEAKRLAFIDEDLRKSDKDTTAVNVYQMSSCKYSKLLGWNGRGIFPPHEREQLRRYVSMAHRHGKKVRLWASPENNKVWKELLQCGVDLINTDKLVELRNFLIPYSNPASYDNATITMLPPGITKSK